MQLKHGSAAISVVTSSGADIDVHASWVDLADGATTCTPDDDNTQITTATTTAVVAGVSTTTVRRLKYLNLRNIDSSVTNDVTVTHSDGATTVTLVKQTLLPGDTLQYTDESGWAYKAWSATRSVYSLAADQSNSTTTPTSVSGLISDTLQPGTYVFRYYVRYQAGATTTGVKFDVNFTGTVTAFVWNWHVVDTTATAATAAADQDAVAATGQVYSVFASRAKGTAGRGTTISVDTANADMFAVIEGIMTVTVAGQLDLYHGSEVAAASTVMAGSSLILTKTG
jgi:hypothetical protein